MKAWDELVTTSLLGTERRPLALPPDDRPVGRLLGAIDPADQEAALLDAAAVVSLYRRAGDVPVRTPVPAAAPAEPDEMKALPPDCERYLEECLTGAYSVVLAECLARMASARYRVPDRLLPTTLAAALRPGAPVDLTLAVLDRRGRWLAAQDEAWSRLLVREDPDVWETGGPAARRDHLARVRRDDPARARQMLAECWPQEKADDRAAFLATFVAGLGTDDEPFLEERLDDRSKEVVLVAADLLARLPGSRFCQRMIERVGQLVRVKRGMLGKTTLDVTLPEKADKELQRDGVEAKPPHSNLGDKAWTLARIVGYTPLTYWTQQAGISAADMARACGKQEWSSALFAGLCLAERRAPDAAWAEALTRQWLSMKEWDHWPLEWRPAYEGLGKTLERLILSYLAEAEPLFDGHPAYRLLEQHPGPYSRELARAVVASMRKRQLASVDVMRKPIWTMVSNLPAIATRMPLDTADDLLRWYDSPDEETAANEQSEWRAYVRKFQAVLRFRHAMHHAIAPQ